MAINYNNITNEQVLEIVDILSKVEAIDGALADIQTTRANAESGHVTKEQELTAEKNKLRENMRQIRTAHVTG